MPAKKTTPRTKKKRKDESSEIVEEIKEPRKKKRKKVEEPQVEKPKKKRKKRAPLEKKEEVVKQKESEEKEEVKEVVTHEKLKAEKRVDAPPPRKKCRKKKKSGSGGFIFFLIILAGAACVGVYVSQQQTASVVSKLSDLEETLEGKIGNIKEDLEQNIEEGIDKVQEKVQEKAEEKSLEKANEAAAKAVEDATTKKYTSAIHDFAFRYPNAYEIMQLDTDFSAERRERVLLARTADKKILEAIPGGTEGPAFISFTLYKNDSTTDLSTWLKVRAEFVSLDDDAKITNVSYGDMEGLYYTQEDVILSETVTFSNDEYVMVIKNAYNVEENNSMQQDFQQIVKTFSF